MPKIIQHHRLLISFISIVPLSVGIPLPSVANELFDAFCAGAAIGSLISGRSMPEGCLRDETLPQRQTSPRYVPSQIRPQRQASPRYIPSQIRPATEYRYRGLTPLQIEGRNSNATRPNDQDTSTPDWDW